MVKNPDHEGSAQIFYHDIGDYLTREDKLETIARLPSVLSDEFKIITPNNKGEGLTINLGGMQVTFYISGEQPQEIMETIKANLKELADRVAGELARTVGEVHGNQCLEA